MVAEQDECCYQSKAQMSQCDLLKEFSFLCLLRVLLRGQARDGKKTMVCGLCQWAISGAYVVTTPFNIKFLFCSSYFLRDECNTCINKKPQLKTCNPFNIVHNTCSWQLQNVCSCTKHLEVKTANSKVKTNEKTKGAQESLNVTGRRVVE